MFILNEQNEKIKTEAVILSKQSQEKDREIEEKQI